MRYRIAIMLALLAINANAATLWLDADDKEISRPYSIGPHINATDEQLAAYGIRAVEAPDCPRKYWLPLGKDG